MKKSISFFVAVAVALVLISGCGSPSVHICEPGPYPLPPPPEMFEFPYDYFPDWIYFETEYAVYAPDVQEILVNLENKMTLPRHFIHTGFGFSLVRRTDDGWITVPLEGGGIMVGIAVSYGYLFTRTLKNGCTDWDSINTFPSIRTTNIPRLTPGTYRIVDNVLVNDERIVAAGREVRVWEGYIWAEFEVR